MLAKRASVAATVAQNVEQKKLDSSLARSTARQRQFARGAGSSSLALAGLRGATLAAGGPFLAAAAAVTAFSKSVQNAASLQTSLNVFGETTGATAGQLQDAAQQAKDLGRDLTLPAVSASDAAEAFTELGKAGLSVEDSLAGARGVLQLATAAQIDNAQATELSASALNAFGLAGDQAIHVADLLTGAANEAQGSIADMGIALQQSSAAARQVGVNLDDTVAILTLLARNGLRGSDAGTSLRTAFLRLIRPTKNAARVCSISSTFGSGMRKGMFGLRSSPISELRSRASPGSSAMPHSRPSLDRTLSGPLPSSPGRECRASTTSRQ